jgi:hypothetical protein
MLERGLITPDELRAGVEEIRGDLVRYPGLDAVAFEARVRDFVERHAD